MRKNILTAAFICLAAFVSLAQPPSGPARPGTVYGSPTDGQNALSASELPVLLKKQDTVQVKVTARVLEVCSKKGCWLTFKVDESQDAFVKMKDYAFFVPLDMVGKNVVLEGKAYTKTTSVAELKHYAEDAKKPKHEIAAITQPKTEIRFMADGIVVVE
jgi:hypothetical protein